MSFDFYKVMHFLGIFMVFSALGGQFVQALNGATPNQLPGRRWIGILHGVGLLIILVAGFAMFAKLKIPLEPWLIGKIIIWLVLGGIGVVVTRKKSLAGLIWIVTLALGVGAAFLARTHYSF